MNAIIIFSVATVVNVSLSTIRSICTIKCGKWLSALSNAVCYGFYPLIVMLTANGTVNIGINMVITAVANFICVWLIKYVEEKARKDKMWKVEMAIPWYQAKEVINCLNRMRVEDFIPFNYNHLGDWYVFNCYCTTKRKTAFVRDLAKNYNGKISAYESQPLV